VVLNELRAECSKGFPFERVGLQGAGASSRERPRLREGLGFQFGTNAYRQPVLLSCVFIDRRRSITVQAIISIFTRAGNPELGAGFDAEIIRFEPETAQAPELSTSVSDRSATLRKCNPADACSADQAVRFIFDVHNASCWHSVSFEHAHCFHARQRLRFPADRTPLTNHRIIESA
jgi:hypothetical protein